MLHKPTIFHTFASDNQRDTYHSHLFGFLNATYTNCGQ